MNTFGVGRIEPDRLVEVGDGAVEIALCEEHAAAIGEGARVTWIETDRRRKILERDW